MHYFDTNITVRLIRMTSPHTELYEITIVDKAKR